MSAFQVMNLFTLLNHSLRQEARSVSAHRFRIGSLLIATWLLLSAHYYSWLVGGVGREFVRSLTYLDLLLILIAGSSYFGSVITEEKEQGTLGLLKIAGFSNAGLMLGKSTARIATALVIFLIQLPFPFLAIILGGTSSQQIVAAYLSLTAFLILLGNVGLFLSVVCRRNSSATSLTFLTGLILLWSGELASFAMTAGVARKVAVVRSALEWIVEWQEWFSAEVRLRQILQYRHTPFVNGQFWGSLAAAAVLFGVAWLLFDRFTEYTEVHDPHRPRTRWKTQRWQLWVSRPRGDVLAWKEFHFSAGGYTAMLGKSVLYVALFLLALRYEKWFQQLYATSLMEVLHGTLFLILTLELLSFSGQFLGGEYTSGTLPNLLLTPHSLGRIVCSKAWGAMLTLAPTLVAIVVASKLLQNRDAVLLEWSPREVVAIGVFVVLLHLTAFYSLRVRRGAVAWAFATLVLSLVFILPLLEAVRIALLPPSQKASAFRIPDGPEVWAPFLYISVLTCLALQIGIAVQTRRAVGE